ncbi:BatA and WFA domain-containing protein [Planctomycetota bacterium]|nr:BatA and WFA domain-containing protein [Planctomycetota bacterium]
MPGFFALGSSLLFLLFVPLIVMYFLKLRRQQVEVPSLVLWRKVLADSRVNSPFQKFKKHLLLLLQLLLLTAMILGAMQPFIKGDKDNFKSVPILIDHSASMGALDMAGGETRLDVVKGKVNQIIDNLNPDQQVCLIGFADSARKLTDFTNDKRLLRSVLDDIEIWDVESGVEDALRMVDALGQRHRFSRVLMYTDGNIPDHVSGKLAFNLELMHVDQGGSNAGITALSAKQNDMDGWDVFVSVETNSVSKVTGDLRMTLNDELVARQAVSLTADMPERVTMGLSGVKDGMVKVQYVPDGFDALNADNKAFLEVKPVRDLVVGVSEDLPVLGRAIEGLNGIELDVIDDGSEPLEEYDLVVRKYKKQVAGEGGDDVEAEIGPHGKVEVLCGGVPNELEGMLKIGSHEDGDEVASAMKQSELLRHLHLEDTVFINRVKYGEYEDGSRVMEDDLEKKGWEVLAHGSEGPLIIRSRVQGRLKYALLFNMEDTQLPYTPTPPMLAENLKQITLYQSGLLELRGKKTGVLDTIRELDNETDYVVEGVKQSGGVVSRTVKSNKRGEILGVEVKHAGAYEIKGTNVKVGASLLSPKETAMNKVDEIRFDELVAGSTNSDVMIDKPIWKWFAVIGLTFLLVEWWFYQRKPGGWGRKVAR